MDQQAPINKNGDESLLTNYRPISILSCSSKLLERIVYNRIYKFLVDHEILVENLFGFQAACSTGHAILQLTSHIENSFNSGKITLRAFTDFSNVFNTVDYSILIKNLTNMELKTKFLVGLKVI